MKNIDINDYKNLSNCIYPENRNYKPKDWEYMGKRENNKTGFYSEAYYNKYNDSICIVYRGTDNKKHLPNKNDLINDLNMLKNVPAQTTDAFNFYYDLQRKYQDKEISITGHSLGGSLAQIVGTITGANTYTFGAYGTGNLLKNIKYKNNITNYGNEKDIIFMKNINNHIGNTKVIKTNGTSSLFENPFKYHYLNNLGNINNAVNYKTKFSPEISNIKITPTSHNLLNNNNNNNIYTREMIGKMSVDEYLLHEPMIMEQLKTQGIPSEKQINKQSNLAGFLNQISGNSNIFTREDIKNMTTDEYLKNEKAIDFQRIFGRAESSECERARNIKQSAEVEGEACNGMQGLR